MAGPIRVLTWPRSQDFCQMQAQGCSESCSEAEAGGKRAGTGFQELGAKEPADPVPRPTNVEPAPRRPLLASPH